MLDKLPKGGICLIAAVLLTTSVFADKQISQNGLTISSEVTKRATFLLSELKTRFESDNPLKDVSKISLAHDNAALTKAYDIRIIARNNLISGRDMAVLKSKQPYTVRGTTPTLIDPSYDQANFGYEARMNSSEITAAIQSSFGTTDFSKASLTFDNLPPNNVTTYIIEAYDANTKRKIATLTDEYEMIHEPGHINVVRPNNTSVVGNQVDFVWTPVTVRTGVDVIYTIYFSNQQNFRIADALYSVDVSNRNSLTLFFNDLERYRLTGRIYWQVFAKDGEGFPIGSDGKSPQAYFEQVDNTFAPPVVTTDPKETLNPDSEKKTSDVSSIEDSTSTNLSDNPTLLNTTADSPTLSKADVRRAFSNALTDLGITNSNGWRVVRLKMGNTRISFDEYLELMTQQDNVAELKKLK